MCPKPRRVHSTRSILSSMDAPTFRACSRPIRKLSLIEWKLLSILGNIYLTSSLSSPVLLNGFRLTVNQNGSAESLYIVRVSFCHHEENVLLFCFSIIEGRPTIWTDQYLAVLIPKFIDETLEVYNYHQSLNREAAEVNRGLVEILQSFDS